MHPTIARSWLNFCQNHIKWPFWELFQSLSLEIFTILLSTTLRVHFSNCIKKRDKKVKKMLEVQDDLANQFLSNFWGKGCIFTLSIEISCWVVDYRSFDAFLIDFFGEYFRDWASKCWTQKPWKIVKWKMNAFSLHFLRCALKESGIELSEHCPIRQDCEWPGNIAKMIFPCYVNFIMSFYRSFSHL